MKNQTLKLNVPTFKRAQKAWHAYAMSCATRIVAPVMPVVGEGSSRD